MWDGGYGLAGANPRRSWGQSDETQSVGLLIGYRACTARSRSGCARLPIALMMGKNAPAFFCHGMQCSTTNAARNVFEQLSDKSDRERTRLRGRVSSNVTLAIRVAVTVGWVDGG